MNRFIYEIEGVRVPIERKEFEDIHGVTLCCIILNEEKGIREFLKYYKPYFKEILMVDLGSTDRTVEFASPLVDVMIIYKQDGHHSNGINRVLEQVKTDWAFLIDCDERVEEHILKNLSSLIDQDITDCYAFPRKNFVDGLPEEKAPLDFQDRLFRSYCRMIRPVHQEVVGYKKKTTLASVDGNYIIHSKRSDRHLARNIGYHLYEYKFRHEMGFPGAQLADSFKMKYPDSNWEHILKMVKIK